MIFWVSLVLIDISTAYAVGTFRIKVNCIMSIDGIEIRLMTWLVNEVVMLLFVCQLLTSI